MKPKDTLSPFYITQICSAHDFHWDDRFRFNGESHASCEVVYLFSGEVEITENERVCRLSGGQMIVHAPWEFHRIRSLPASSPHVAVSAFMAKGKFPENLFSGVFTLTPPEKIVCEDIFRNLFALRCAETPPEHAAACALELSAFFLRLSLSRSGQETPSGGIGAGRYGEVVSCMTEAVGENLSLAEIAGRTHLSVSYLKALFRTYAGVSPGAYYDRLRCREACRRLIAGESVREVAEGLGFSSPNYFSLFFRRQTGILPSRYAGRKADPGK